MSKLKEERELAGYSLEYVAKKLNIRKQYLVALEEENYDAIPGRIYADGYKKMYYEFLGITISQEQNDSLSKAKIVNNNDKTGVGNKYKKYIIFCSVILLVLVLMFYNLLKLQDQENYITKSDTIQDGINKEIPDGPYKTDS